MWILNGEFRKSYGSYPRAIVAIIFQMTNGKSLEIEKCTVWHLSGRGKSGWCLGILWKLFDELSQKVRRAKVQVGSGGRD